MAVHDYRTDEFISHETNLGVKVTEFNVLHHSKQWKMLLAEVGLQSVVLTCQIIIHFENEYYDRGCNVQNKNLQLKNKHNSM